VQLGDDGVVGFLFVRGKCESKKGSSFLDTAELLSRALKSRAFTKTCPLLFGLASSFFGEILHLILTLHVQKFSKIFLYF